MNNISKSDFIAVLRETVNNGKDLSFTPTGVSMKPTLNGTTDTVVLTKKPQKLKKYDIALYLRRRDNALVLHRIMRVIGDTYTMSGDNQYYYDDNISYDDILAVVKSINRNGKNISVNSFSYHFFLRFVLFKKYVKIFIYKFKSKLNLV